MRDELFEYVVSGLKSRKGQWTRIAGAAGVSTKTLSRIVNGDNNNRRDTLLAVAEYLKACAPAESLTATHAASPQ